MEGRDKPRSFSGPSDEEWKRYGAVIDDWLGPGKRSMYLHILVRRTNELAQWDIEKKATIEQRADHTIRDSLHFFGIKTVFTPPPTAQ